jgi:D-amino-acid dehydrogenase
MKVAVLGAGVVGVATAYFLARDGHEVVLVERRAKAAARPRAAAEDGRPRAYAGA